MLFVRSLVHAVRLIKSARSSLVVTSSGKVEYVYREDISLCPQNKAQIASGRVGTKVQQNEYTGMSQM